MEAKSKHRKKKSTAAPFTLITKEAYRQLAVKLDAGLDGSTLPCKSTPTSLRVKLDRQLTFKQHIEALRGKVASRNNLLRRLAGSSWGAHTRTQIPNRRPRTRL